MYPGPRLPGSEVVKLTTHRCDHRSSLDGIPIETFWTEGVEILAGKHLFSGHLSWDTDYRNCSKSDTFDYSAQSYCQSERAKDISKKGSSYRTCSNCEFTHWKKYCDVTTNGVTCTQNFHFKKGETHLLDCGAEGQYGFSLDTKLITSCVLEKPYNGSWNQDCGTGCYATCSSP